MMTYGFNKPLIIQESSEEVTSINFNSFDRNKYLNKVLKQYNLDKSKNISLFEKVVIDEENHTISIYGINYKKMVEHIKKLYQNQNIYKIFEFIYNDKDWENYESNKIKKSKVKIEYIKTYDFFALELVTLFKELYERYKINSYDRIAKDIYNNSWLYKADHNEPESIDLSMLDKLKFIPKDFQKEFIEKYPELKANLNLNGYCLAFDQGLGKTFTSIALEECLHDDKVVIVCPNSLKENWSIEIQKYLNNINRYKDIYLSGVDKNYNNQKFVIVNNEGIDKIIPIVNKKGKSILIIDESQNFRNLNGEKLSFLLELKAKLQPDDILVMSGTPIKASPSEICPTLLLIDPHFTLEAAEIYNRCFKLNKALSTNIVQNRFNKIMYRKTKDEVLELPKKFIYDLFLEIDSKKNEKYLVLSVRNDVRNKFIEIYKENEKDYEKYENRFIYLVNKLASQAPDDDIERYLTISLSGLSSFSMSESDKDFVKNFVSKYIKSHRNNPEEEKEYDEIVKKFVRRYQSCMGKAIGEILVKRRVEMYIDIFDHNKNEIEEMIEKANKKTIIFTTYVKVAKYIADKLNNDGIKTSLILGEVKNRQEILNDFKNNTKTECLVCTSQTLGTGVTLIEANQMLFFGTPWRSADFEQCCDRIYRIGQTDDVYIYKVLLFTTEANLSTRMDEILEWSNKMIDTYII